MKRRSDGSFLGFKSIGHFVCYVVSVAAIESAFETAFEWFND